MRWPELSPTVLVDDAKSRAPAKHLQGLEKLDNGISLGAAQSAPLLVLGLCLSVMGFDGLAQGRVLTVVKIGRLVGHSPQLSGQEHWVAGKKLRRAGWMSLVEGLAIRVIWPCGNVVQFQIGKRRHPNNALVADS